jgi:hypothetical protein
MTQIAYEIKDENGVTEKDRNLEQTHAIPLGTLVEVVVGDVIEYGCRLFVVAHARDYDGTPLYGLSFNPNACKEYEQVTSEWTTYQNKDVKVFDDLYKTVLSRIQGSITTGFSETSLVVIKLS